VKLIITRSEFSRVDNGGAQWFLELAHQWVQSFARGGRVNSSA
jgi:hypothetical protein